MLEADEAGIEALCYSSLRQELLAASDEQGNLQAICCLKKDTLRGLSFSTQNSDLLISGGNDAQLSFWDVKNAKQIQQVSVESGISALSYHSGGYLLAAGTSEGSMLLFDLRTFGLLTTVAKTSPAEPMQRFAAHAEDGGALRAISFMEEVKVPKAAFSPSGTGALSPAGDPVKSFLQEKVPSYATIESMMERLSKRVSARTSGKCFATPSEWNRWQRRCHRLSQLQGRIKLPLLTSFTVEGVTHDLPMKSVGPPERHPTREELEYLVGFFDGDGCVTMGAGNGEIYLNIGQNIDSAHVLLHYRELLGGGISRHKIGTGKTKAVLQWQICGSKMRHVAALLGQIPSMKQAQLKIAAGGKIAGPRRERIGEQLFQLKQKDHIAKKLTCTWAYFAGFFDAEGSVTVHASWVGLQLDVIQINPFILKCLLEFLHDSKLDLWRLLQGQNSARLVCRDLATSKQTMKHLLDHGLLVKQKQAQLALSLNAANHKTVREAVMELNGWQKKYNRLDEEGVRRAKELDKLRGKLRRSSCSKEQELLKGEIQELREEHMFQKLVTKCHLMRKDMRKLLGGCICSVETVVSHITKVAEDVLTSPVDLNSAPTSEMSRSSFTWPSVPAQVPPLPSNERSSLTAPNIPETPQDARQVARYSIGSPADEPIVTSSPWWKQVAEMSAQEAKAPLATEATNLKFEAPEAPPATATAPTAGGGAATAAAPTAVVEALKPLLMELRKDFRNEVQEAQLALMEQNFQLHSQLRKDVDALRAEVEQMRGELRQLK
eukprot:symbB.v1.2.011927.t2/scaffold809.1/size160600/6